MSEDPLVSVYLPSYNKPEYVGQAIQSVLDQTYQNWELWILENSDDEGPDCTREVIHGLNIPAHPQVIYEEIEYTPEARQRVYPTAELLNKYYPWAQGKYIFYLSDDDLFDPDCFETCVNFLEAGNHSAAWFSLRLAYVKGPDLGPFPDNGPGIPANRTVGQGYEQSLNCKMDGGQIVHTRDILKHIPQPYFPSARDYFSRQCDGAFLTSLARVCVIPNIPRALVTHRTTPVSTWTKNP